MKIEKTVLARGASSITDGVMTRLTKLLDCSEAELAVRKAVRAFQKSFGRKPDTVQLAVSFLVPCRPSVGQRVQIPAWCFAAKAMDSQNPAHNPEHYADPDDDATPIELRHLGNGRYGLA